MYSLFFTFDVVRKFREICLSIDEIIYRFINYLFSVFDILSRTRLFSSDIIADFTNRTYIILSVVMLFALAYAIMTVIINPDKATNGDKSGFGIVKRVIVALIVLVFTPTVFNFAYGVQESVIDSNVIGKLVLGRTQSTTTEELKGEFVVSLFQGSFYLTDKAGDLATLEYEDASLSAKINGDIGAFEDLLDYVENGQARYNNLLSLIIGLFAAYCLVIFCFDLGVRCAKLAFFEMIAPIPALLYIIPGKESSFKTWTKEILNTFLEVFVRVGVIYFITYAFYLISKAFDNGSLLGDIASPSSAVGITVKLFIILGLLVFALRVPKLICDILGIKSEGLFSFKKRWDEAKASITKPISAATAPVRKVGDKVAGMAFGLHYANKARKYGEEVREKKQTKGQSFMTAAGGLVNGFRGGFRHAGHAFDYEMSNQQWYSSAEYESMSGLKRSVAGLDNRLRNNVGAPTLYKEKEAQIELDYNHKLAEIETRLSARKKAAAQRINDINNTFDPVIQRDEAYMKAIKDIEDHCNKQVQKEDSSIVIGGIQSAVWDKRSKSWKSMTLSGEGNYSSILAINEQLKDNEGLDPTLRTKLISQNTALLKQLGGMYKSAVEHGGYTTASGTRVNVKQDVELDNLKSALHTTIDNYGDLLGLDETNIDDKDHRSYTVINEASSLKDLHDKLDDIRANNASGRKAIELSRGPITYKERPDGPDINETLFVANQKNEQDEKLKKDLSEERANQQMALSGYKQMDERKNLYKREKK